MLWDKLTDKSDELLNFLTENSKVELSDEQLRQLAEKLQQTGYVGRKINQQEEYDYQSAYRQLPGRQRRLAFRGLIRVAAILGLPLFLGIAAYFLLSESGRTELQLSEQEQVKPGERKAVLKMADGSEVELTGQQGEIKEINGVAIYMDSLGLRYEGGGKSEEIVEIENRIRIPRGGEYLLVLSDGTKVWLNADSELKYPVVFGKKRREVTIVGEAYLEVVRDTTRPFVVRTAMGSVEVLGTKFNVQAYRGEQRLVTTLVEGAVACRQFKGDRSVVLKPDQQVVIDATGIGEVRTVKTGIYTGWKNGMFVFENERLEDILNQLSRWYDIEVFYSDMQLKNLHFSGDLSRFKDISVFFRMFENSADITFSLKGKTLTVGRK